MSTTSATSKFAILKCVSCAAIFNDCACKDPKPVEVTFVAIGPFAWGRGKDIETAVKNCKAEVSSAYVRKPYKIGVFEVQQFDGISDMDGGISYKGDVKPVLVKTLENQRPPRH